MDDRNAYYKILKALWHESRDASAIAREAEISTKVAVAYLEELGGLEAVSGDAYHDGFVSPDPALGDSLGRGRPDRDGPGISPRPLLAFARGAGIRTHRALAGAISSRCAAGDSRAPSRPAAGAKTQGCLLIAD